MTIHTFPLQRRIDLWQKTTVPYSNRLVIFETNQLCSKHYLNRFYFKGFNYWVIFWFDPIFLNSSTCSKFTNNKLFLSSPLWFCSLLKTTVFECYKLFCNSLVLQIEFLLWNSGHLFYIFFKLLCKFKLPFLQFKSNLVFSKDSL